LHEETALLSLAESDRKLALDRYRILRPHIEDERTLSVVASEAGIAYSTAQRWVSLYRRFGLTALVRKRRSDRGQRRALSAKLRQVVEALALEKPPLPIVPCIDTAITIFGEASRIHVESMSESRSGLQELYG
jgi:hypothetical protein